MSCGAGGYQCARHRETRTVTTPAEKSERWALIVVLIGAASMLMLNLGGREFGVADVTRYAQMVMEMRYHDSLVPTIDGMPYHAAAPLAAWLPFASSRLLGGLTPATLLLPSALAAFATLLVIHRLTRALSYRTATIAVAFGALCYLTWIYGRQSRVDWVTAFAHIGAVGASYGACTTPGRRRLSWWLAGGLFLGLGVASKGLFAPGILAATLGPFVLYTRRWRAMIEGSVILLSVAALVTVAWFVPYSRVLGPEGTQLFVRVFLGQETVSKFGGDMGKSHGFFWYFLRGTPLLAPLTILAGIGMFRVFRRPKQAHPLIQLSASGVIFPVLLLSLAGGKHLRYLVPLVPAMAILSAWVVKPWFDAPGPRLRAVWFRTARIAGVILAAAGVAGIGVSVLWLSSLGYAILVGAAAVAGGIYAVRRARSPHAAFLGIFFAMAALISYDFAVFMPSSHAETQETYLELSRIIAPHLDDAEVLVVTDAELPREPAPPDSFSCSALSLYLMPRWIEMRDPDDLPDDAVVLARKLKPGRKVRLKIDWKRRGWTDEWYLLDPVR